MSSVQAKSYLFSEIFKAPLLDEFATAPARVTVGRTHKRKPGEGLGEGWEGVETEWRL